MKKIIIIGAGGFGREVKFLIDRINNIHQTYEILGFYDDNDRLDNLVNGIPLLGTINDLIATTDKVAIALGIGVPQVKENIIKRLSKNLNFEYPNIIDPTAIVGNDGVTIGLGNVICANVVITCNIKLGNFLTINLGSTVGHDTLIDNYSSFMPSVNISGDVQVGKSVYVGTGAKIINLLDIGANTIVGAGAVVSKSLPANCTAVGIPAKPIKFHNE